MDRRLYVLTESGEMGPFDVDDLKRAVVAGTLRHVDQVRTPLGKSVGTVADLIGTSAPPHRQTPSGPRLARRSAPPEPLPYAQGRFRRGAEINNHPWLPVVLIGILVLLLAVLWLMRGRDG